MLDFSDRFKYHRHMNDIRIITGRQSKPYLKPKAALAFGHLNDEFGGIPVLYCILTIGNAVTVMSEEMQKDGEYEKAAALDLEADEHLLTFEKELEKRIKKLCREEGYGIRKRLEPGIHLPLEIIRDAFKETDAARTLSMQLTSSGMMDPVKSECLIFELSSDLSEANTEHDCSACNLKNCRFMALRKSISATGTYGIAIDLGSTTLAFSLVDLENGESSKPTISLNHQRTYGADVITRIRAAMNGKDKDLRFRIQQDLRDGISALLKEHQISEKQVKNLVIAGNTTMLHLLRGYPCGGLSSFPFHPVTLKEEQLLASDLFGNETCPVPKETETMILPGISAFVGADIVSGLYALDFDQRTKNTVFVDLGTNSEMALLTNGHIITASAAAGSAFERIARQQLEGVGTDIIAKCAALLKDGTMDPTGLLHGENPNFSQQDIRDIQLAKAAIYAGIEALLSHAGLTAKAIDTLFLAGTFGEKLDLDAAFMIGLIPQEFYGHVCACGNTSLNGAIRYLTDQKGSLRIAGILAITEEIPLADDPFFQNIYLEQLNFSNISSRP